MRLPFNLWLRWLSLDLVYINVLPAYAMHFHCAWHPSPLSSNLLINVTDNKGALSRNLHCKTFHTFVLPIFVSNLSNIHITQLAKWLILHSLVKSDIRWCRVYHVSVWERRIDRDGALLGPKNEERWKDIRGYWLVGKDCLLEWIDSDGCWWLVSELLQYFGMNGILSIKEPSWRYITAWKDTRFCWTVFLCI